MKEQQLRLSLFDPGMTAMHRAGLGGLVATLRALERDGETIDGLSWVIEPQAVTFSFPEDGAAALVELVKRSIGCEDGLVTVRAFRDLATYTEEARAHHTACLLGTFLQHMPTAVEMDKARKAPRTFDVDGQPIAVTVPYLLDVVHRWAAEDLVDDKGRFVTKPVRVKGWAFPGAAERHASAPESAHSEPPERLLALLFAPIGCVAFRVRAAMGGDKFGFALLVPEFDDLESFAEVRRRLVGGQALLTVASAGDAALRLFTELHAAKQLNRMRVRRCHAFALGKVAWNANQKSRTERLVVERPSDLTLRQLAAAERHFPVRARAGKKGGYLEVPAWRELVTSNLARGMPWWSGLGSALADRDQRPKLLVYEREGVRSMTQQLLKEGTLGTDRQRRFVEAMHEALRIRYGQIHDRIVREGLDRRAVYDRENEQLRVSLGRCKNAATFRSAVTDLWSRSGRNAVLQEHWPLMLEFFSEESWMLGRDLALLALASYSRSSADDGDESSAAA